MPRASNRTRVESSAFRYSVSSSINAKKSSPAYTPTPPNMLRARTPATVRRSCSSTKSRYPSLTLVLPALDVEQAGAVLDRPRGETDNEGDGEDAAPHRIERQRAGSGVIARDLERGQHRDQRKQAGGLSPQDGQRAEGGLGWAPAIEARKKSRRDSRPGAVELPEPPAEKLLFGEHDALVVKPEYQTHDDRRPPGSGEERHAEPHERIAQVERMAHHRVEAAGSERFGPGTPGPPSRSGAWREADRRRAQDQPSQRQQEAAAFPGELEPAVGHPVGRGRGHQQHRREKQGQVSAVPVEPGAGVFELLTQTHRRPRSLVELGDALDDAPDQPVAQRGLRAEPEVAVGVLLDPLQRLSRLPGEDAVE